jgi:hypothetical protein
LRSVSFIFIRLSLNYGNSSKSKPLFGTALNSIEPENTLSVALPRPLVGAPCPRAFIVPPDNDVPQFQSIKRFIAQFGATRIFSIFISLLLEKRIVLVSDNVEKFVFNDFIFFTIFVFSYSNI